MKKHEGLQTRIMEYLQTNTSGATVEKIMEHVRDEIELDLSPRNTVSQNLRQMRERDEIQYVDGNWCVVPRTPDHPHPHPHVASHGSHPTELPKYMNGWSGESIAIYVDPKKLDHVLRIRLCFRNGSSFFVPVITQLRITIAADKPENLSPAAVFYSDVDELKVTYLKSEGPIEEQIQVQPDFKVFVDKA